METYEETAKKLAQKVVDEGPSYPDPKTIWRFLNEAARQGLITLHFTPPEQ